MSIEVGELDYNDDEALNDGSSFAETDDLEAKIGGATELHIVDIQAEDIDYSSEEETPMILKNLCRSRKKRIRMQFNVKQGL